ncbi:septum site-determining protein Ssd [Embleya sp. NPDC005575]|uniref:septum site-determining protein Ssd n=1 Tax=Embleya sp. NPDC005575 TaxID=3156892 RepID=UPI0033B9510D
MAALSPPRPARPLLVTGDPALLDDLLRLCAAAGIEPEVQPDAGAARTAWPAAPLVIVGDDVTPGLARCGLPRREDVVLIGADLDDGDVWRRALDVGADHVVFLPDAEAWIVDRLGDVAEGTGPDAHTIAVLGGCGGSGASTLACALAVTAGRRGLSTALVDVDPSGVRTGSLAGVYRVNAHLSRWGRVLRAVWIIVRFLGLLADFASDPCNLPVHGGF